MPARAQQTTRSRWVAVFLAALVAVLATLLSSASASAATTAVAQNRVGASTDAIEIPVEPPQHIGAGQRLGQAADRARIAVATGVAVEVESGIYIVNSADGVYVGQSGNISARLSRHVSDGKFLADEVANAARQGVEGAKIDREIAEQLMIDRLGGIDELLNKVNPIGARRFNLMTSQPYVR